MGKSLIQRRNTTIYSPIVVDIKSTENLNSQIVSIMWTQL